jgi:hypothetical protein
MTDEEKQTLLHQCRETLERTAHIRPRMIIDARPEGRIPKWKREGEEQTAREEAEIRRRRRFEKQGAAAEHTADWIDRTRMLDMLEAASRGVGEAIEQVRAKLHEEFTTKYAELNAQFERVRANHERELERERTAHQRMQDLLMKQLESMEQAHQRESVGQQRQYLALKQYMENTFDELFSSSHDNVWDAIEAFRDGYRKRATGAQIRQIRQIA